MLRISSGKYEHPTELKMKIMERYGFLRIFFVENQRYLKFSENELHDIFFAQKLIKIGNNLCLISASTEA